MKKFLLFIILLFICSTPIYAESKNILVKSEEISNVTKYTTDTEDGVSSVILDGNQVNISSNEDELVLIKLEGDALNWISTKNGKGNYYYVSGDSEDAISSISSDNVYINVYDLDGNLISRETNIANVNLDAFYIQIVKMESKPIEDEVNYRDIDLIIEGKGRVIIDGKVYEESTKVTISKDSILLFMSDNGYKFTSFLIDNKDLTSMVSSNRYELDGFPESSIKVVFSEFEEIETTTSVNISGYIKMNNLPLQNIKMILHSDEMSTISNNDGYFEFENVSVGDHELLLLTTNGDALGYMKFSVLKNGDATFKTTSNNMDVINVGNNFNDVTINLEVNDKYKIDLVNAYSIKVEEESKGFNYLWIIIPLIIVLVVVVIIKKYK